MEKKQIIIIDPDCDWVQKLVKTFVRHDDFYLAGVFYNGLDALTVIENRHPDIIIMGSTLPGCCGTYIANYIHSGIAGYRPFIYLVTEYSVQDIVQLRHLYRMDIRLFASRKPLKSELVRLYTLRFMNLDSFQLHEVDRNAVRRINNQIAEFMMQLDYKRYLKRSLAAEMAFRYLLIESPDNLEMKELHDYVGINYGGRQSAGNFLRGYAEAVRTKGLKYYQEHFSSSIYEEPGAFYWQAYLLLKQSMPLETQSSLPFLKENHASDKLARVLPRGFF